jgi:hypothetical protein
MMPPIPINIAFEDLLSYAVLLKLLRASAKSYLVGTAFTKGGSDYLKKMTPAFNNASKGMPHILLTDLDTSACPPELISSWLGNQIRHPNLIFRVAVREVEAWVMADGPGFAKFLGIKRGLVPEDVDELTDPKAKLLELAGRSPRKKLRLDIVPRRGTTSRVGPNYNGRLSAFVVSHWDIQTASQRSRSLLRTIRALNLFVPTWPET